VLSGNLSFLNWLTIVPILACFDDRQLARVVPRRLAECAARSAAAGRASKGQRIAVGALALLVAVLSIAPVANLLASEQRMNGSFEPLELVNTYGAFGSVGAERREIVFEGTDADALGPDTRWRAYEFPGKPGDVNRRPAWIAPYQPRLDWQIWFAAMSSPARYPWVFHFVAKLLEGDPRVRGLLANDPFPDRPPRFVRARLYRYRFAPPGSPRGESSGAWWERTLLGEWLPPLARDDPDLRRILAVYGWREDEPEARPGSRAEGR
jgi:hypothetical protein